MDWRTYHPVVFGRKADNIKADHQVLHLLAPFLSAKSAEFLAKDSVLPVCGDRSCMAKCGQFLGMKDTR